VHKHGYFCWHMYNLRQREYSCHVLWIIQAWVNIHATFDINIYWISWKLKYHLFLTFLLYITGGSALELMPEAVSLVPSHLWSHMKTRRKVYGLTAVLWLAIFGKFHVTDAFLMTSYGFYTHIETGRIFLFSIWLLKSFTFQM